MQITSEMIKRLRDKTGAGMMDCKRALEASGGNMEAAIEHLRKKGAAVAQKRADRSAKEGVIVARVAPGGKRGVIAEINCETDFVGRSEDFLRFADQVTDAIDRHEPASINDIPGLMTASGKTISELLNDLLAKVGEKIEVRRFRVFQTTDGHISSYIHLGNKIGVLVELAGGIPADEYSSLGRNIAMQIAAMNPLVVTREQVDQNAIAREMDIYRTQATNEGKPQQIVEKIALGRLEKFYQEVCLLEQTFIKDSGKTVRDTINEVSVKVGGTISVRRFERFHLGEEQA